jgi:hypothetical protein
MSNGNWKMELVFAHPVSPHQFSQGQLKNTGDEQNVLSEIQDILRAVNRWGNKLHPFIRPDQHCSGH